MRFGESVQQNSIGALLLLIHHTIAVEPPEDAPIAIEGAVRIALDKDTFVDASQVRVGVRHRTVRLTGAVHSEEAREAAE